MARGVRSVAVTALLAMLLTGCSSLSHVIADSWPRALGGLPEGVPPRPGTPPPYLAIHDMPPPRENERLTPEERKKLEEEMAATRSQTATQAEETRSQSPAR